jgi:hypothetical protein
MIFTNFYTIPIEIFQLFLNFIEKAKNGEKGVKVVDRGTAPNHPHRH